MEENWCIRSTGRNWTKSQNPVVNLEEGENHLHPVGKESINETKHENKEFFIDHSIEDEDNIDNLKSAIERENGTSANREIFMIIPWKKEIVEKHFRVKHGDKVKDKLVRFIFEDQTSDWVSIQQVRTIKDLQNLAVRTIKGLPGTFLVFSEGKPLEDLTDLASMNILRILETKIAPQDPISKSKQEVKLNEPLEKRVYSIFRTKNSVDPEDNEEDLDDNSDAFNFDKTQNNCTIEQCKILL
jgi:hypothetical protein